jgi:DNA protecting protein DprA
MSYEQYHALWLCCVVTDNAVKRRLLKAFGTPSGVYTASPEELRERGNIPPESEKKLLSSRTSAYCDRLLHRLEKDGIRFVWHEDTEYPVRLREIPDPPLGLFMQGAFSDKKCEVAVAVVGTRRSSPYGEFVAKQFGQGFAEAGVPVVSGLAMGIDAAVHKGCLTGDGFPIAVLGSGIGTPYPRDNALLYRSVADRGVIVSEYGPGVPALPHHFPHRNRLISGLSDGVVVVEAQEKSGTIITVDRALDQGKSVYVVPGRVTDRNSIGCNQLIREGAQLVTSPGEVLADLVAHTGAMLRTEEEDGQIRMVTAEEPDHTRRNASEKNTKKPLASDEKIVYAFLRLSPKHFDQLIWESGLTPSELTNALYRLEREGLIVRLTGGCYSVRDTGRTDR